MPRLASAVAPAIVTPINAVHTSSPSISTNVGQPYSALDTKLILLGSQGVGKTSIIARFVDHHAPLDARSTIGPAFHNKKTHDQDTNTTVRYQIWDTAGQERFKALARLYYRDASACILCYDVTSQQSWLDMKGWLEELQENCEFSFNERSPGRGMVLHIVGTKTDLVAHDPDRRQVPFDQTVLFAAEQIAALTRSAATTHVSTTPLNMRRGNATAAVRDVLASPDSKRSSGFWNSDLGWDSCHEVSALNNDGIEEAFRVVTKKLIQQRDRRVAHEAQQTPWPTSAGSVNTDDYFGSMHTRPSGSFRVGYGEHRKSWLGLPTLTGTGLGVGLNSGGETNMNGGNGVTNDPEIARRRGKCC